MTQDDRKLTIDELRKTHPEMARELECAIWNIQRILRRIEKRNVFDSGPHDMDPEDKFGL